MNIGILSDTHGNLARTRVALDLLRKAGVELVIHCGDVGAEAVLAELATAFGSRGIPVHAVAGNVDAWDPDVLQFPSSTGVRMASRYVELDMEGRRLYATHGHDDRLLSQAIESGLYDYVLHGHTHLARDERAGRTRIINPGAVHRAAQPSVAVLDTSRDELTFLKLPSG